MEDGFEDADEFSQSISCHVHYGDKLACGDKLAPLLSKVAVSGLNSFVKVLLKAGANPNGRAQHRPLVGAAHNNHVDVVKTLVIAQADVNLSCSRCFFRDTPLHSACAHEGCTSRV